MKTIFITSYHSLIFRNILKTDVLSILAGRDLRIVILVSFPKVDYFRENFHNENIEVVGIEPKKGFLDDWIYFFSVCLISVENLFIRSLRDKKRYIRFYLAHVIYHALERFVVMKKMLRYLYGRFITGNTFEGLLEKYKPVLVFSTDIYHVYDRDLVAEAKSRGIFTIGMVRSWDNVTTKGVMLAVPDKIIVPNEILKNELWQYNRIGKENIFVSGIPHYDICVKSRSIARNDFFKEIGLDPEKKLIFFAPAGTRLYKYDGEILKLLQKIKNGGRLNDAVQFFVRFHPGGTSNPNDFAADGDFAFDEPGLKLSGSNKEKELTEEDNERLNDALCYSDIVMTVVSTIAIDGAVFDKPTIVLSFNPFGKKDDDIKKFMRDFHFKKFIAFGLCRVANGEDELVEQINGYLKNPALDREKRREIVNKYCYKLDGNSSRRVAEFILNNVNESKS